MNRILVMLCLLVISANASWKVPWLFEHPRDGKFKVIEWKNDSFDNTSFQHLGGSYFGTVALDIIYDKVGVDNSSIWAFTTMLGLGLLKEVEDGYREGFSRRDLLMDFIGCSLGYFTMVGLRYIHNENRIEIVYTISL